MKTFCEERELTVILAVDISASGSFGSFRLSKMETAVEVAAVLMFTGATKPRQGRPALFYR